MSEPITRSCGNVFEDLGLPDAEALNEEAKAQALSNGIKSNDIELPELDQRAIDTREYWKDDKSGYGVICILQGDLSCRERQLREKDAEIAWLKVACGLSCELHGCSSVNCTTSAYLKHAEDMFSTIEEQRIELTSLRASVGEKEFMQQNAKDISALLKDAIYPGQKLDNIYALIRHALIYVNLQLDRVAPPSTEKVS